MPFLRHDGTLEELKGDWESVTPYANKAGAVGIANEVIEGTTEIKEDAYYLELTRIKEYNAALPPVVIAKPEPPLTNAELKAVRALLGGGLKV